LKKSIYKSSITKKSYTLLAILSLLLTNQLQGQEKFNIYARAGVKSLMTEGYSDINNGEAYILGREGEHDSPFFFGIDFNLKIAPKWRLSLQTDFLNEYEQRFHNLTNRYVFSHSLNVEEFLEYHFAPVFTSIIFEREFSFLEKLTIVPKAGAGLRIVNRRGFEIVSSNASSNLNQLEIVNLAFNNSFNKVDPNFTFGVKMEYARFYLDLNLIYSFNNSFTEKLIYEGRAHRTEAQHTFFSFGIGYNILH